MVWDIFSHLAAFDFAWLLALAFGNLLVIFMFICLAHIFFNGKNTARAFLHLLFAPLFIFALIPFLGWSDVSGSLVAFYYLINLTFMKLLEGTKFFSKRLIWVEEFTFFGSVVLFNLFGGF